MALKHYSSHCVHSNSFNNGYGINQHVGGATALGVAIPPLRSSGLHPGRVQGGQNKGSNPKAKPTPQGKNRRERHGLGNANPNKIVNRT